MSTIFNVGNRVGRPERVRPPPRERTGRSPTTASASSDKPNVEPLRTVLAVDQYAEEVDVVGHQAGEEEVGAGGGNALVEEGAEGVIEGEVMKGGSAALGGNGDEPGQGGVSVSVGWEADGIAGGPVVHWEVS